MPKKERKGKPGEKRIRHRHSRNQLRELRIKHRHNRNQLRQQ
jgi:hypothetical protein